MRHLSKKDVNTLISAAVGSTLLIFFLSRPKVDEAQILPQKDQQIEETMMQLD